MEYDPSSELLKTWPLYPVAESGESFFVLAEGYASGGRPLPARDYVAYCRKQGKFRSKRVPVPNRAQALRDAQLLRQSPRWKAIRWSARGNNWSYTIPEASVWDFIRILSTNIPASRADKTQPAGKQGRR